MADSRKLVVAEISKIEDSNDSEVELPGLYRIYVRMSDGSANSLVVADGDKILRVFGNRIFAETRRIFEDVVSGDIFVLNDRTVRAHRERWARWCVRALFSEFKREFGYDELHRIFQEECLVVPIMES